MDLSRQLAIEARAVFENLRGGAITESLCGFAIYTCDEADGVDIAANTVEKIEEKISKFRGIKDRSSEKFAYKWYTTEWAYEGGHYCSFKNTHEIIERLFEEKGPDARTIVIQSMIESLEILNNDGVFDVPAGRESLIVLASITNSEDDEWIMLESLKRANPEKIYENYLREKEVTWR